MEIEILFLIIFLLSGIAAGFCSGLFGIGGGIILVPVFLTVFPYFHTSPDVVMHCAISTSLALIIPTGIMSTRKQYNMGKLDLNLFKKWSPWIILGSILADFIMPIAPASALKIFFTIYIGLCVLIALFKKAASEEILTGPPALVRNIMGTLVGFLSVLLGIGGGTFTVPLLNFFKYPLKNAIALSSATGLFIGIIGTIGAIYFGLGIVGRPSYSLGYVNMLAFIAITPTVMIFAPYGSKVANSLPKNTLRWVYAGFLVFVFVYMLCKI